MFKSNVNSQHIYYTVCSFETASRVNLKDFLSISIHFTKSMLSRNPRRQQCEKKKNTLHFK